MSVFYRNKDKIQVNLPLVWLVNRITITQEKLHA